MKIIREGFDFDHNPVRFSCHVCGCIFLATRGEYTISHPVSFSMGADAKTGLQLRCECPNCKTRTCKRTFFDEEALTL